MTENETSQAAETARLEAKIEAADTYSKLVEARLAVACQALGGGITGQQAKALRKEIERRVTLYNQGRLWTATTKDTCAGNCAECCGTGPDAYPCPRTLR